MTAAGARSRLVQATQSICGAVATEVMTWLLESQLQGHRFRYRPAEHTDRQLSPAGPGGPDNSQAGLLHCRPQAQLAAMGNCFSVEDYTPVSCDGSPDDFVTYAASRCRSPPGSPTASCCSSS